MLSFPKLQLEVPGRISGREITWMLIFICSYCKAQENITFCIFQESQSKLEQRDCIPTAFLIQVQQYGTIPIQTCCRASAWADSAPWIHTWAPQHMNRLLCSKIQTWAYEAWRTDSSSKGPQKNPSGRVKEAFRARCRSGRAEPGQDLTACRGDLPGAISSQFICLLYPWLKHGLTSLSILCSR